VQLPSQFQNSLWLMGAYSFGALLSSLVIPAVLSLLLAWQLRRNGILEECDQYMYGEGQ
jgi:ABC-type sugar transport system permease subunit